MFRGQKRSISSHINKKTGNLYMSWFSISGTMSGINTDPVH